MAFASGVYSGLVNSFNNAVSGTIIDPFDWNDLFSDIETSFNTVSKGNIYTKVDVASASTCDIGATATQAVRITGTTTITSLGTTASTLRFVYFAAALKLTHNATSLILPNGTDITTRAGDSAIFLSDASGNWRCLSISRAQGLPFYFAADFGVAAANSAATNTTAMNALITILNSGGGVVYMPAGVLAFNAWNAITGNGVSIRGMGQYAGGTTLNFANATGDCITVNGAPHFTLEECWLTASVRRTSGFAIKITGSCFIPVLRSLRIDYHYDGVWVHTAAQARIDHVSWRYMLGTKPLYTGGASGGVYGLIMTDLTMDNPVPTGAYGTVKAWATSTAYTANDIVLVNSKVWQCTTSGTSSNAGTGPSTIPGTVGSDAFSATVTDGTAVWKFVMQSTLYWFYLDSLTYSVTLDNSAAISGMIGVLMDDSVASGSSYPMWINTHGLEIDHPYDTCVYLLKGENVILHNAWLGSALQGRGVYYGPSFRGESLIGPGTRIAGCWTDGVYISAGPTNIKIHGSNIYLNSIAGSGSYDGIAVAAGATYFDIIGNTIGKGPQGTGNQRYGVYVAVGASDSYVVLGNMLHGNATGALSDGGTGTDKEVAFNPPAITPRIYATTFEVGHASDTTLSRSSAGVLAVEGVAVALNSFSRAHTAASLAVSDSNFQLALSSGNPFYGFDANDYMLYDRTTNVLYTVVGAAIVLSQTAARISGSVPFGLPSYTVAGLPTGAAGDIAYASNGRKNGEGVGSGTGVLVFKDGTAWRACDTGATVAA